MKNKIGFLALSLAPVAAFAQEALDAAARAEATAKISAGTMGNPYFAAAMCMGIAAAVVAFSQSRAAVAALEGIGRNPGAADKIQTPLILSLALMESIGLLAFVVAFLLQAK
jgi:F-type H+-transporting ATPase subunit c